MTPAAGKEQRAGGVVVLVGTGPRGLSVLERLLLRAAEDPDGRPLDIWTVDDVEPGVGRIWRVDQSRWPTMNTLAGEVTMYSAPADRPTRLGRGLAVAGLAEAGRVDADWYEDLVRLAVVVSRSVAATPPSADRSDRSSRSSRSDRSGGPDNPGRARAERVWRAARRLADCAAADDRYRDLREPPDAGPGRSGAVAEALRKLARDWPAVRAGTLSGEQAYAAEPGLWERLMTELPMGAFARLAATFVNDRVGAGDPVVELGAGEGATTRLLRLPASAPFLRTDANPMLVRRRGLPGTPARYDFDEPSPVRDAALVLAVNSLHCARDTVRTLGHVREMLRPDGCLVLCEGAATTDATGLPSVLEAVFGQFRGWWDRAGFRDGDDWAADLGAAGLAVCGRAEVTAGHRVLGSLLWATRR